MEVLMAIRTILQWSRSVYLGMVVTALAIPAAGQQPAQPSPAAVAMARELLDLEVPPPAALSNSLADVIEQHKGRFLRSDIGLTEDLNEIAITLRSKYTPRVADLTGEIAHTYAQRFTDQELKDLLAFLKTPTGRKFLIERPKILHEVERRVEEWKMRISSDIGDDMLQELRKKGHDL
jgi:hypothetical protein